MSDTDITTRTIHQQERTVNMGYTNWLQSHINHNSDNNPSPWDIVAHTWDHIQEAGATITQAQQIPSKREFNTWWWPYRSKRVLWRHADITLRGTIFKENYKHKFLGLRRLNIWRSLPDYAFKWATCGPWWRTHFCRVSECTKCLQLMISEVNTSIHSRILWLPVFPRR
jgi:hypothetical protein